MNGEDFISVVIPYYKREYHLQSLLDSISSYNNYPYETIVHDDDGNSLSSIKHKDRVSELILNTGLNVGLARAINRAVSIASSKYILMLNDDMVLTRPIFREIVSVLRHPYIGLLSLYGEHSNPAEYVRTDVGARFTVRPSIGANCVMAFRKDFWRDVDGYFEEMMSCYADTVLAFKNWKYGYFRAYMLDAGIHSISLENNNGQDTTMKQYSHGETDMALPKVFGVDNLGIARSRFETFNTTFRENEHTPESLYNHTHWHNYSLEVVPDEGKFSTINWEAAKRYGQDKWRHVIERESISNS